MKLLVQKGSTSVRVFVSFLDSASTTGGYKTAVTAAKLVAAYSREDDGNNGATVISLSNGTRGTWSSGGVVEKDSTNARGEIEFGIPNAALAAGSNTVTIHFKDAGSNNIAEQKLEIQLVSFNPNDAVRMGLTSLPNADAEAVNGLYTRGTGAGQIRQDEAGRIDANMTGFADRDQVYFNGQLQSYSSGPPHLGMLASNFNGDATNWTFRFVWESSADYEFKNHCIAFDNITKQGTWLKPWPTGLTGQPQYIAEGYVELPTVLGAAAEEAIADVHGPGVYDDTADVPAGMEAQGYTTARAAYLDNLQAGAVALASALAAVAANITTLMTNNPLLFAYGTTTGTPTTTEIQGTGGNLSAIDNAYVDQFLVLREGALPGAAAKITAYVGSTKTFTTRAFASAPATGIAFSVMGKDSPS